MKSRILYLTRSLEIGGLERVITLLANNLDRDRFETFVCCTAVAGKMAESLERRDSLHVLGNTGRINLRGLSRVRNLIRDLSADLVHSHEMAGLLYGYPAARSMRIPIVHTKHGYIGMDQEKMLVAWIGRRFGRSVSEYVCVSTELKRRMQRELGLGEDRISVIYNGIEPSVKPRDRRGGRGSAAVIGCVGRLTQVKNYELLISAFGELRDRYPLCRLEIVGGGEREKELRGLIEGLSLADRITLHGYQLDVSRYYERFDIFVLASFFEGLSVSLLEAMSRGIPCVASRVGGNPEIIEDGVNGFLFESGSRSDLVSKLSFALDNLDSPLMDRIRSNALETCDTKFSIRAMVARHEELYGRLLGRL